jgi:hypothetical protein
MDVLQRLRRWKFLETMDVRWISTRNIARLVDNLGSNVKHLRILVPAFKLRPADYAFVASAIARRSDLKITFKVRAQDAHKSPQEKLWWRQQRNVVWDES